MGWFKLVEGQNCLFVVLMGSGKMLVVFFWGFDCCSWFLEDVELGVCVFYVLLFKVFVYDIECNLCLFFVGIGYVVMWFGELYCMSCVDVCIGDMLQCDCQC